MTDPNILNGVDDLQVRYMRALDGRDMPAWLYCFDNEASYVCTTRENEEQGLSLAMMMDDCRDRLRDRVNYVTEVWAGTFEDYMTRHFAQRLDCTLREDGLYAVTSNFTIVYTTTAGRSEILAAGSYEDAVVLRDGETRFRSRRAVLDTTVVPRYLVYPV